MTQQTGKTRFERGLEKLAEVDGTAGKEVVEPLGDLGKYIVEFGFGDLYSRDGLSLRDREIATVAMLTVLAGREPQLRLHLGAALNVGLTAAEIEEVIIHTVTFAGFPTAINAMNLLHSIVEAREGQTPAGTPTDADATNVPVAEGGIATERTSD